MRTHGANGWPCEMTQRGPLSWPEAWTPSQKGRARVGRAGLSTATQLGVTGSWGYVVQRQQNTFSSGSRAGGARPHIRRGRDQRLRSDRVDLAGNLRQTERQEITKYVEVRKTSNITLAKEGIARYVFKYFELKTQFIKVQRIQQRQCREGNS